MSAENIAKQLQQNNVLMLGAVAGGLFILYQLVSGIKKGGEAAAGAVDKVVSKPIADFIVWITANKPNVANATMIFQSGNTAPASDFSVVPGSGISRDSTGREYSLMNYRSQQYRVYARTPNGYYPAVLNQV